MKTRRMKHEATKNRKIDEMSMFNHMLFYGRSVAFDGSRWEETAEETFLWYKFASSFMLFV